MALLDDFEVVDPALVTAEIDVVDTPRDDALLHFQLRIINNVGHGGVETVPLAFGGKTLADIVVSRIAGRYEVVGEFDGPEQRVGVVAGGVGRVGPDPVGAAPPELSGRKGSYADKSIADGGDLVYYRLIAAVGGYELQLRVALDPTEAEVFSAQLEGHGFGK